MLRIVGLNSPDSDSTERRLRGGFHDARRPKSGGSGCGAAQGVAEPDEAAEVDRAVALCMELLHGDGCGVAEEANLMMRCVCDPVASFALRWGLCPRSTRLSIAQKRLEGFARQSQTTRLCRSFDVAILRRLRLCLIL